MKWIVISALLSTGCASVTPLMPPPPAIPTPPVHFVVFAVANVAGAPVVGLQGQITPELYREIACRPVADGVVACKLTVQAGSAVVVLGAPGYDPIMFEIDLPATDTTYNDITLKASQSGYTQT
mgnify:CR=1 FL=1